MLQVAAGRITSIENKIEWPHWESNTRPFGLQYSVSTNYATKCGSLWWNTEPGSPRGRKKQKVGEQWQLYCSPDTTKAMKSRRWDWHDKQTHDEEETRIDNVILMSRRETVTRDTRYRWENITINYRETRYEHITWISGVKQGPVAEFCEHYISGPLKRKAWPAQQITGSQDSVQRS
jgi:hypothetical protein